MKGNDSQRRMECASGVLHGPLADGPPAGSELSMAPEKSLGFAAAAETMPNVYRAVRSVATMRGVSDPAVRGVSFPFADDLLAAACGTVGAAGLRSAGFADPAALAGPFGARLLLIWAPC